jgi:hypothetical protein
MIQITIDTDRPEYAGAAKWPELSRVLRDLANKFEQYTQDKYRIPMILTDAFGQPHRLVAVPFQTTRRPAKAPSTRFRLPALPAGRVARVKTPAAAAGPLS